jgi:uncharacterized membrane protein YbaN (DUF454 family)
MEEAAEQKNSAKVSGAEIAWIAISGTIALAGLVMVILGIVGDYLPGKTSENWILLGEASFKKVMMMNYRWFGVILIIGAAFISVIYLNIFAKKSDIDEERALRRQQRLQVISQSAPATPAPAAQPAATEVASTPVKKD